MEKTKAGSPNGLGEGPRDSLENVLWPEHPAHASTHRLEADATGLVTMARPRRNKNSLPRLA